MPNYVTNKLLFPKADDNKFKEILSRIGNEDRIIDFNRMIPMPEDLNLECSSLGMKGYEYIVHKKALSGELQNPDKYLKGYSFFPEDKKNQILLNFEGMPQENKLESYYLGTRYFKNFTDYGYLTWYEWCVDNWGTKWNSCESYLEDDCIVFTTAWSNVLPVIFEISKLFPDTMINYGYYDEDLGFNLGYFEIENEKILSSNIPTGGTKEAYELLFDLAPEFTREFEYSESSGTYEFKTYSDDDEEIY